MLQSVRVSEFKDAEIQSQADVAATYKNYIGAKESD